MKVLFVDHADHLKTHSADFFLEILRESFEVETFYYGKSYRFKIPQDKIDNADIIIFWEFLYNRRDLGIRGKRCLFVPMYDNEWSSKWQWRRIAASGMAVISLCGAITRHARECGVKDILDIRYFPDPADFPQSDGDIKRVFLWERGEFGETQTRRLFPESYGFTLDIKRPDEFVERQEYLERLSKCGTVVAPRMKEGIGMSFLEAMAMGKCVVANNDATMNEYITDGESGILRNFSKSVQPITADDVAAVKANVMTCAKKAYARWLADKNKIAPFIESIAKLPPLKAHSRCDSLHYVLFLLEGARQRLLS